MPSLVNAFEASLGARATSAPDERDCRAPASGPLRLRDGRAVLLRAVRAADAHATGRFVEDLSPQTRRWRFHGAVNRLSPALLQAMTAVDPCRQVVLVAEVDGGVGGAGEPTPRLVADARYVVSDDEPRVGEFALVVADAWQGAGLGHALLDRLVAEARRRRLWRLTGDVLADNGPMRQLLLAAGAELRPLRGTANLLRATLALVPSV
jgi:acetyltransferase